MLTFRKVTDSDMALIKLWLNKEHVKKWFEIPSHNIFIKDWIYEIEHRGNEFRWINYLITEYDKRPIGYVQYYDCYDAEEEWYELPNQGEIFSMDYLIGEPDYIGKGIGKTMIKALTDIIISDNVNVRQIIVSPDMNNLSSCRALVSNGFVYDEIKKYYYYDLNGQR